MSAIGSRRRNSTPVRGMASSGLDGARLGSVDEVNFAARTIDIKKRKDTATHHPRSGVFHAHVSSKALRESLMRLGEAVLENGLDLEAPYAVARRLLLREPPPTNAPNGALQHAGEPTLDAACRIALALDGDVLPIQGPPGTGKTYTGARIICELVRAGLRVGVTAVSHKVIVNLLEAAAEQAVGTGLEVSMVHCRKGRYEGPWAIERMDGYPVIRSGLGAGSIKVLGATAWCWARPDFEHSVDVLIVDEAGQMSLVNVLACAPAARSLVLLGDPQQLEQPLQSSHPEGSDVSALAHLLDGADTMPADKGLFLAETPSAASRHREVHVRDLLRGESRVAPGSRAAGARATDTPGWSWRGPVLSMCPSSSGQPGSIAGRGRVHQETDRYSPCAFQLVRSGWKRSSSRDGGHSGRGALQRSGIDTR